MNLFLPENIPPKMNGAIKTSDVAKEFLKVFVPLRLSST